MLDREVKELLQQVTVRSDGCVSLGPLVTCDGFSSTSPIRIQTHVHTDHLTDFETSKGHQDFIISSSVTRELLIAEFNSDLAYRQSQLIGLENLPNSLDVCGAKISLYPSAHMPGSAMVKVDYGYYSCAYSSDFDWPLGEIPQNVDVLVVDATYGDPKYQKHYDQTAVIESLLTSFIEMSSRGPVVITGYRGRLQFAYQLLSTISRIPFFASPKLWKTLPTYARVQGLDESRIKLLKLPEVRRLTSRGESVAIFVDLRDREILKGLEDKPKLILSAYLVPQQEPILRHENGNIRVALTDHADFKGTIELVRAINPRLVIADGSRGGNADSLANYIRYELGLPAFSDQKPHSFNWGS